MTKIMDEVLEKWKEFKKIAYRADWNFDTFMVWYANQEANKSWVPKEGEKYWLTGVYEVEEITWFGDSGDQLRLKSGNIFKTRELAEAALERVKAALKSV